MTDAAAHYATARPRLDDISRLALITMPPASGTDDTDDPGMGRPADAADDPEAALWDVLADAPDKGISVPELVAAIGMSRRWVYYRLGKLAAAGRAVQTTRGLWRIASQGGSHE